jgi:DNA (cytosine-5)-methyltransferase 1
MFLECSTKFDTYDCTSGVWTLFEKSELGIEDVANYGALSAEQRKTFVDTGKLPTSVLQALLMEKRLGNVVKLETKREFSVSESLNVLSFFSGAMGLDLGLEKAGLHVLLACENDKACQKTITHNRPNLPLINNLNCYSADDIRRLAGLSQRDEIDVMVGGPPCQAFSTAGARRGFHDARGNVFLKYIDLITELRPRYAVIENVRGLLSAPLSHRPHAEREQSWSPSRDEAPGGALLYVLDTLRRNGYGVSFNLYNSANYGVPQVRERVVMICHRDGDKVPHLQPTHAQEGKFGLPTWRTLREALVGLNECTHAVFPETRLRYYRMLKEGQYWKHLPESLQREAMGKSYYSGGGKTGFLRRLAWDKPSCTLVTSPTMPATDIGHPEADRPLSVQEYKRIQQFPDTWHVCGSLTDQYRQIGNAVPVGLGEAIGRAILNHANGVKEHTPLGFAFSRYKGTDEISWERLTRGAELFQNSNATEQQSKLNQMALFS